MMVPTEIPLSISDKAFSRSSLTENLRTLRSHGFTHLHFAHKWTHPQPLSEEELEQWQAALTENRMQVLDVHGCHPKDMQLWSPDPEQRAAAVDRLNHRLRVTRTLGGDALVYHVPYHIEPTRQVLEWFIEGLRRAQDTALGLGVKIALENHYGNENDRLALELAFATFDADFIGFTFDPGHALISGNSDWIFNHCASRLCVLHLNDNDGSGDHHWLPFDSAGIADWDRIIRFIAESPYKKPIQLEVCWNPEHHGDRQRFLQQAAAAGRSLATKIHSCSRFLVHR